MDIRQFSVPETAVFQLQDAAERPMYADGDTSKPMRVHLYSPGSKQYAKAQADRNTRLVERINVKGKMAPMTVEESIREKATYLADCTYSWENVEFEGKQGRDLSMAIYSETNLGFIADQNAKRLGDWKDFLKDSQPT
ncbi:MAG TPA: hypothetical protein VGD76_04645 [Ramlibacter sp.]